MDKNKRLGKEYRNTCLVEFRNNYDVKKMVEVLSRLKMITETEADSFRWIEELNVDNPGFSKLVEKMNAISPDGCSFQVKYKYQRLKESERMITYISIGFFE